MLKLIFKNLWARRRRNGWLLAELILVSVVTWVIIDPVVVLMHDRNLPLGYDADRIFLISLSSLQPGASDYMEEAEDSAALVDNYLRLVKKVEQFNGVEFATPLLSFCYPSSQSISNSGYLADSTEISALQISFLPKTHFFETYGIQGKGEITAEQLSAKDYGVHDVIMTEDLMQQFYGLTDVRSKTCFSVYHSDTTYFPVVGAVHNVKMHRFWRPSPMVFVPLLEIDTDDIPEDSKILVRLKPGVTMQTFLHDFRPWMNQEMKAGNLFARTASSYDDIISRSEFLGGITNKFRMNTALAVFFLMNLCLGVIGTFWLQTRVRREEIGVILAFGGRPSYIVRMLLGEGVVLTFLAVFTGCFGYLQYALKEGLYSGENWMQIVDNQYWVTHFSLHFIVVSFIVFIILLLVVLAGIYIPARKISRIPPADALRDE